MVLHSKPPKLAPRHARSEPPKRAPETLVLHPEKTSARAAPNHTLTLTPTHPPTHPPTHRNAVTGLHDLDEYVQAQLLLAALGVAAGCLRPGGAFVAKIFRGRDAATLYAQLRALFADVAVAKPRASRNASVEAFVVCRGFAPPPGLGGPGALARALAAAAAGAGGEGASGGLGILDDSGEPSLAAARLVPFLACGDLSGWDADRSYALPAEGYARRAPAAPPAAPPHAEAAARAARAGGGGGPG